MPKEVSAHLKGSEIQKHINSTSIPNAAGLQRTDTRQSYSTTLRQYLRDQRLKEVKSGTVHAELDDVQTGVQKLPSHKWGYGLPSNPVEHLQLPSPHNVSQTQIDAS